MASLAVRVTIELVDDTGLQLDRIEIQNFTDASAGGESNRRVLEVATDKYTTLDTDLSPRWWFLMNAGTNTINLVYGSETVHTLSAGHFSVVRGDNVPSAIAVGGTSKLMVAIYN